MWGPIDRFLHVEAASGIILLIAAAVALAWANSPWYESYHHLWETPVQVRFGNWSAEYSLHFIINDLLMTIFFLVVGLEIKREIVEGALSDVRRAALPIAGAIGGMVVPAAIYLGLAGSGPAREGWGVPMATDIAFAVGILTLLGSRVPAALRVLLLAIAIIDDIGAILVIALFYSSGFAVGGLAVGVVGVALLLLLLKMGVRPGLIFAVPLTIIWVGMYSAGVHPTIAGVIAGLMAPVRSWFGKEGFLQAAREALDDFQQRISRSHTDHELMGPLTRLAQARREALSPAFRVETALHPWVAYFIMPVFALANAGVHVQGIQVDDPGFTVVMFGILFGLVLGKPVGVLLASWLAIRLRLADLPDDVRWSGMFVLGSVAGIGFTMSIFISELAFDDAQLLAVGKLAVLLATGLAAGISLLAGRVFLAPPPADTGPVPTPGQVEGSTEYWTADPHPAVGGVRE